VPLQRRKQDRVVLQRRYAGPAHDYAIETTQLLLILAKTLSRHSLDPVTDDGRPGNFAGNSQAEAGMRQSVGASQHGEIAVAGFDRLGEHVGEGIAARQPDAARKRRAAGHGLGRKPGATLGAAGLDHPTATFGSHPGAKPVSALAVNDAGLKCALHGDSLGRVQKRRKEAGGPFVLTKPAKLLIQGRICKRCASR